MHKLFPDFCLGKLNWKFYLMIYHQIKNTIIFSTASEISITALGEISFSTIVSNHLSSNGLAYESNSYCIHLRFGFPFLLPLSAK